MDNVKKSLLDEKIGLAGTLLMVPLGFPTGMLRTWVLLKGYAWFIQATFGAPDIQFWTAAGILAMISFTLFSFSSLKEDKGVTWWEYIICLFRSAIVSLTTLYTFAIIRIIQVF